MLHGLEHDCRRGLCVCTRCVLIRCKANRRILPTLAKQRRLDHVSVLIKAIRPPTLCVSFANRQNATWSLLSFETLLLGFVADRLRSRRRPSISAMHLVHALLLGASAALLATNSITTAAIVDPCALGELSCDPGARYGDVDDCSVFYECDDAFGDAASRFVRRRCAAGSTFHVRKSVCTSRAKRACARSCANERRRLRKQSVVNATVAVVVVDAGVGVTDGDNMSAQVMTVAAALGNATVTPATTAPATTTTTTTTTATSPPTPPPTTNASTVAPPVVLNVNSGVSLTNQYHVVTQPVSTSVAPPTTEGGAAASPMIGAVIGASAGGLVLVIVVIVLIVCCIRRRRYNKHRRIPKVENPQYSKQPQSYRFSRDSTLYVGNTVALQNNNSLCEKPAKRRAPDSPAMSDAVEMGTLKRRAPPPPNPFTLEIDGELGRSINDLYEKDSRASSENLGLSTFTARNDTANSSFCGDKSGDDGDVDQSGATDDGSDGSDGATDDNTTDDNTTDDNALTAPLMSASGEEEEEEEEESEEGEGTSGGEEEGGKGGREGIGARPDPAVLGKSLDEYDKTLNPFCA